MFILDSLLTGGLRFVFDKIAAAVDTESMDDSALREQLLDAQMRLELGELTEEEFSVIEKDVFARIREIKSSRGAGLTMTPGDRISGVEIESFTEHRRR